MSGSYNTFVLTIEKSVTNVDRCSVDDSPVAWEVLSSLHSMGIVGILPLMAFKVLDAEVYFS